MRKYLLSLVLLSVVSASIFRMESPWSQAIPAAQAAEKTSYTLPIILLLTGLGITWWGFRQNKKYKEAQSSSSSSSLGAQEAAQIPPLPLNPTDSHTSRPVRDETAPSNEATGEYAGPPTSPFGRVLNRNIESLSEAYISKPDDFKTLTTIQRLPENAPDLYKNKKSQAHNLHVYWALQNAQCDLKEITDSTTLNKSETWKKIFEAKKGKGWNATFENTETSKVFEAIGGLKTGSIIVYDCNETDEAALPRVSMVTPSERHPPYAPGKSTVTGFHKFPADSLATEQKCKKVAGVYEPTGDSCTGTP